MSDAPDRESIAVELTADIVAAYVSKNRLPTTELSDLIASVHAAVSSIGQPKVAAPVISKQLPAIAINRSVTPDYLVCLETGKQFQSLRRHLNALGMTAEQYRSKWDLPHDYPMVAANYAARRSELAKTLGLGKKGKGADRAVNETAN